MRMDVVCGSDVRHMTCWRRKATRTLVGTWNDLTEAEGTRHGRQAKGRERALVPPSPVGVCAAFVFLLFLPPFRLFFLSLAHFGTSRRSPPPCPRRRRPVLVLKVARRALAATTAERTRAPRAGTRRAPKGRNPPRETGLSFQFPHQPQPSAGYIYIHTIQSQVLLAWDALSLQVVVALAPTLLAPLVASRFPPLEEQSRPLFSRPRSVPLQRRRLPSLLVNLLPPSLLQCHLPPPPPPTKLMTTTSL